MWIHHEGHDCSRSASHSFLVESLHVVCTLLKTAYRQICAFSSLVLFLCCVYIYNSYVQAEKYQIPSSSFPLCCACIKYEVFVPKHYSGVSMFVFAYQSFLIIRHGQHDWCICACVKKRGERVTCSFVIQRSNSKCCFQTCIIGNCMWNSLLFLNWLK